jgi:hypothetical protein
MHGATIKKKRQTYLHVKLQRSFPDVCSIVMRDDTDWCVVYDFVFDRLRAVRQDMVIQDVGSFDGMMILEPIVRFHGYAGYR